MKTFIFVMVLFAGVMAGFAQSGARPNSFVGIPWGASASEAKRIMGARSGVVVPGTDVSMTGTDRLDCAGGEFAGQEAQSWSLEFTNGKFFAGSVTIQSLAANSLYREFKQHLITKYGPATGEKRLGSAIDRSKSGNLAYWKFNPNLNAKDLVSVTCELNLTAAFDPETGAPLNSGAGTLTVRYTNETLKPAPNSKADDKSLAERPEKPVSGEDL